MSRRISCSSAVGASAIFGFRFAFERDREYGNAGQDQRNAQQHSHGEAAPKKAELDIGLAKKVANEARNAVADCKRPRDDAGSLECAGPHQKAEYDEKHDAFQRGFIKLAGMP